MKRARILIMLLLSCAAFALTQPISLTPTSASGKQDKAPQAIFTVNSAADTSDGACTAGDCTLREAIAAANSNPGADTINFQIGTGRQTINVGSGMIGALPVITGTVTIDGTTQNGFSGTPLIEINGAGAGAGQTGLTVTGTGSTIRGLVINRFDGTGINLQSGGNVIEGNYIGTDADGNIAASNNESGILINNSSNNRIGGATAAARNLLSGNLVHGILIFGNVASANVVQGNFIGTDATGVAAVPNGGDGIAIINSSANTVGGATAGQGNVVSGNVGKGISILGSAASANVVQGNFIGTDATGNARLGNNFDGIDIFDAPNNIIGGTTREVRNVISGNGFNGVRINQSSGNRVQGNFIGIKADGAALGNTFHGVTLSGTSNNTIGGSATGEGNVIGFNGGDGIFIESGTGNAVLSNGLLANGELGIDLGVNGVTPNDTGDPDTGANNLQNFPVLTSANRTIDGGITIQGTLNSSANTAFTLEFFSSAACDPSLNGEGELKVGSTVVTTNAGGNASFTATFATTVATGRAITATATNPQGNTSELSACTTLTGLADMSVGVTAASTATAGSNVSYTITVFNGGPDPATSIVVTDNLPASVSFVSCSSTAGGVCGGTGNNRTVSFPLVSPGGSATITIVAKVSCSVVDGLLINNTVTVSSALPDPATGNNSATSTVTASNPPPSISPLSQSFAASGGSGNVNVTVPAGCDWVATSNASWIEILSGSSGTGSGMVIYSVAANPTGTQRNGTLTIAGRTFTVNQTSDSCSYSISPGSASFAAAGGPGQINVTAPNGCIWKALTDNSWINIVNGNGIGSGTATYSVDANQSSSPRTGTITVEGLTFTVSQAGTTPACTYSISPTSKFFFLSSGDGSVNVTAPAGCAWTAASNASWIEIISGDSGSGNDTVNYIVRDNFSGTARTGTMTIAGRTFTVVQDGGAFGDCSFFINPLFQSFNASGGGGNILVTVEERCAWEAVSDVGWVTITAGAVGVGSGTVSYSVAPNTSSVGRKGIITVGRIRFVVKQKGL